MGVRLTQYHGGKDGNNAHAYPAKPQTHKCCDERVQAHGDDHRDPRWPWLDATSDNREKGIPVMDDAGDLETVRFDGTLECFVVFRQAKPLCGFNHVMENGPDGFCRHRCGDLKGVMGKYLHGHLTSAFALAPLAARTLEVDVVREVILFFMGNLPARRR